jgi:hypothetical protein
MAAPELFAEFSFPQRHRQRVLAYDPHCREPDVEGHRPIVAARKQGIGLDNIVSGDLARLIDARQQPDHFAVPEIASGFVDGTPAAEYRVKQNGAVPVLQRVEAPMCNPQNTLLMPGRSIKLLIPTEVARDSGMISPAIPI